MDAILYRDPEYGALALVQEDDGSFSFIDHGSIDATRATAAIRMDADHIAGRWRPRVRPEVFLANLDRAMQGMGYRHDPMAERAVIVVSDDVARRPDLPVEGKVRVSEAVERAVAAHLGAAVARVAPGIGRVIETSLEAFPRPHRRAGPCNTPLPFFVARATIKPMAEAMGTVRITVKKLGDEWAAVYYLNGRKDDARTYYSGGGDMGAKQDATATADVMRREAEQQGYMVEKAEPKRHGKPTIADGPGTEDGSVGPKMRHGKKTVLENAEKWKDTGDPTDWNPLMDPYVDVGVTSNGESRWVTGVSGGKVRYNVMAGGSGGGTWRGTGVSGEATIAEWRKWAAGGDSRYHILRSYTGLGNVRVTFGASYVSGRLKYMWQPGANAAVYVEPAKWEALQRGQEFGWKRTYPPESEAERRKRLGLPDAVPSQPLPRTAPLIKLDSPVTLVRGAKSASKIKGRFLKFYSYVTPAQGYTSAPHTYAAVQDEHGTVYHIPTSDIEREGAVDRAFRELEKKAEDPSSGVFRWESTWRKALEPMRGSVVRATAEVGEDGIVVLEAAICPPVEVVEGFEGGSLPAFEQHTIGGYREAHIHLERPMPVDVLAAIQSRASACAAANYVEAIEPSVLRVSVPSAVEGYHLGDQAFRDRVNWLMSEAAACGPTLEWVGDMHEGAVTEVKGDINGFVREFWKRNGTDIVEEAKSDFAGGALSGNHTGERSGLLFQEVWGPYVERGADLTAAAKTIQKKRITFRYRSASVSAEMTAALRFTAVEFTWEVVRGYERLGEMLSYRVEWEVAVR